jgi:hypothetical protein
VLTGCRSGLYFLNAPHAPYKQQAVENGSIICQIKTEPPSRAMSEASFGFQMAGRQISAESWLLHVRTTASFA